MHTGAPGEGSWGAAVSARFQAAFPWRARTHYMRTLSGMIFRPRLSSSSAPDHARTRTRRATLRETTRIGTWRTVVDGFLVGDGPFHRSRILFSELAAGRGVGGLAGLSRH